MAEVIHALFVAWQSPTSRRYYPVARLAQFARGDCDECFEFAYVRAVAEAQQEGFLPLLAFPDLHQLYRSRELFPLFANRLLPRTRPDYSEYIEQLGLPPATTSPMTILCRSSGRRATDTLELFPLPEFDPKVGYHTRFWVRGYQYIAPSSMARLETLKPGEQLFPLCDAQNPAVPDAILLRTNDYHNVGFMPTYLIDDAQHLQYMCEVCDIFVERVNSADVPMQQRLLCRLESCWPDGFIPYSTPRYKPLPADAGVVSAPSFAWTS